MSNLFVWRNLQEENRFLRTILTICICALIILIVSIINSFLYRLLKQISTMKNKKQLPLYTTSDDDDDRQLWTDERILNEIRRISRTDNALKLARMRRKRKSKMYELLLTESQSPNIFI